MAVGFRRARSVVQNSLSQLLNARQIAVEPVEGDQVRAARAKDDREVDALAIHRLEHRVWIVTRKVLGRVLVPSRLQVTGARLLAADAPEASPLRPIEERGKNLAFELPAVHVRAVDRREARRAVAKPGLQVAIPEIVGLVRSEEHT